MLRRLALSLLTDAAMDAAVLAAVQWALDRFCLPRLLRGMLTLLACSIGCGMAGLPLWLGQALACPLAAYALLGGRSMRLVMEGAVCMHAVYGACGGFMLLWGARWWLVAPSVLLLCALLARRRHPLWRWNVALCIEKNGLRAELPALIDTGNRLRDRASGLPVLIAEERAVRAIAATLTEGDMHPLPYGVLGSGGTLRCFAPDGVWLVWGNRLRRAPECRVALFPDHMPTGIRALAPPEFMRCAQGRGDSG